MPNLLLTNKCNRSCVYCFANEKISNIGHQWITFKDLEYVCDFIDRSGPREISLLGGEPTLHRQFNLFVKYLLARDFNVGVFSNGIMEKDKADELISIITEANIGIIRFIINVNEAKYRTAGENDLQGYFLSKFGTQSSLSFNIFEHDFDIEDLLNLCRANSIRAIRLGLASRIVNAENTFARPDDYSLISKSIVRLAERCDQLDIEIGFDCGFVLCAFDDSDLGRLYKSGAILKFVCGLPLDIGPDLTTWRCFPLSSLHNRKLTDFSDMNDAGRYYEECFKEYESIGIYEKCSSCSRLKKKLCSGGCIGHYYTARNSVL